MDLNEWVLSDDSTVKIVVRAAKENAKPVEETRLVLTGTGFESEVQAQNAAENWRDALLLTFARSKLAADFRERAPLSALTQAGIEH